MRIQKIEKRAELITERMREAVKSSLEENPFLLCKNIENIRLIRARTGKLIAKISLCDKTQKPEYIFVKAIKPNKKNLIETILYKKPPPYLKPFLPIIYDVRQRYGFYWFLLEELNMLSSPTISMESFKGHIELIARLHSKFYTENSIMKNKEITWIPHFLKGCNKQVNTTRLNRKFMKNIKHPGTAKVLGEDVSLLREAIHKSNKVLSLLKNIPHSLAHGCFEYHHVGLSSRGENPGEMRIIDWANASFAPITLDLVYLIEKSIDHGINDYEYISSHRNNCLNYYCQVMKNYDVNIEENELRNWYNLTCFSKIIGQFIWEELNKIRSGKTSNYTFYRNQLHILRGSLECLK